MSEINGVGQTETSNEAVIAPVRAQVLDSLSKKEDISDFLQEERDQASDKAGKPVRTDERADRYKRALEAARDVADPVQPATEAGVTDVTPDESVDHSEQFERRLKAERAAARYELRASEFAKAVPDYHENVKSVFGVFPPPEHVSEMLLESDVGPQMAHVLCENIDALMELNDLPEREAIRALGQLEGMVRTELRLAQQHGFQSGGARRVSKAPKPLTALSGGATPGRSEAEMAKSENATPLIEAWRAKKQGARK